MKLTDIITKDNEIRLGETQFFIAENDFSFNGLPILKDSLVSYNGNDKIVINFTLLPFFDERNVPNIIEKQLPKDYSKRNYVIERVSSCEFEIERFLRGHKGIWHLNHFDKWNNSMYKHSEIYGKSFGEDITSCAIQIYNK